MSGKVLEQTRGFPGHGANRYYKLAAAQQCWRGRAGGCGGCCGDVGVCVWELFRVLRDRHLVQACMCTPARVYSCCACASRSVVWCVCMCVVCVCMHAAVVRQCLAQCVCAFLPLEPVRPVKMEGMINARTHCVRHHVCVCVCVCVCGRDLRLSKHFGAWLACLASS